VVTTPISGITMFSATSGWGTVQDISTPTLVSSIALTVDGGRTWFNVTPAGLTLESQGTIALSARSATEAWTWLSLYAGGQSTTLWHTTDAGANWASYTVATGAVGSLDFSDSLHGWLTATPNGAAAGEYPIDVWRTTDGGATWAQVAAYPVVAGTAGLSFANATTGFADGCPLGGPLASPINLCVTHDAGGTWSALTSPVPPGYVKGDQLRAALPVFTSPTTGVLEVVSSSIFSLYRTTDAGTSWRFGPPLSVGMVVAPSSVVATGEVFVAPTLSGQVTLYQLPVGGASWTKINTGDGSLALLSGVTRLDFVSQLAGWAVTSSGLIGTTDGGVTWTVLHA
jgi:photosystem II stability/assembly factor-like uncharacterized protein